ncbi:unnamed protein product [Ranitomeya imitator]|uniref:RNA transcription, translation and transport factor protein n=1 Tax=Ranitomeya imitator TaxID=111125 RepID=A0ABN9M424_9NEOB|nr:unnamed protein product [Ranitomeya imitator]
MRSSVGVPEMERNFRGTVLEVISGGTAILDSPMWCHYSKRRIYPTSSGSVVLNGLDLRDLGSKMGTEKFPVPGGGYHLSMCGAVMALENQITAAKYQNAKPIGAGVQKPTEPLINLDVNNPDFKAGVMALANLLQIQRHDDYLVMLKAIKILVQERLSAEAVAKANSSKEASSGLFIKACG